MKSLKGAFYSFALVCALGPHASAKVTGLTAIKCSKIFTLGSSEAVTPSEDLEDLMKFTQTIEAEMKYSEVYGQTTVENINAWSDLLRGPDSLRPEGTRMERESALIVQERTGRFAIGFARMFEFTRFRPDLPTPNMYPVGFGNPFGMPWLFNKDADVMPPAATTIFKIRQSNWKMGQNELSPFNDPHPNLSRLIKNTIYPKRLFEIGRWIITEQRSLTSKERAETRRMMERWIVESFRDEENFEATFIIHVESPELRDYFARRYGFQLLDTVKVSMDGPPQYLLAVESKPFFERLKELIDGS